MKCDALKRQRLMVFLTFHDSESDCGYTLVAPVFHRASVSSSILLLHAVDFQAIVASLKLIVRALSSLGLLGHPAGAPELQAVLLLSPYSAVDGCNINQTGLTVVDTILHIKSGMCVQVRDGRGGYCRCLEMNRFFFLTRFQIFSKRQSGDMGMMGGIDRVEQL